MPHRRPRLLLDVLLKRMRLWPVCGIVGIRQSGKTVLLSQILAPKIGAEYATLDSIRARRAATRSPEAFVSQTQGKHPLIIDEVQKAPDLFDALKLQVDQNRRPGAFFISGSTEFSSKVGIRESLTGRIGISRLFPLTLAELHSQLDLSLYFLKYRPTNAVLSLKAFQTKLDQGGMPGICFLRSERERDEAWSGWLETTCFRDLNQVMKKDHDGELALAVLHELAKVSEPTAVEVGKRVKRDQRIVARYLDALTSIFVLHKLAPHPESVGKDHYVFADCGLASYIGASTDDILRSHVLVEALAAFEYRGHPSPVAQHYRTSRGYRIPIVLSWMKGKNAPSPMAIRCLDGEAPDRGDTDALSAFHTKIEPNARCLLLTQTESSYKEGPIEMHPLRG